jgi:hypothetical protein
MSLHFDEETTYLTLLNICNQFGVDPSASLELENYFRKLLDDYDGPQNQVHIVSWLNAQIQTNFRSIKEIPKWIQSPTWPLVNEQPMIFLGQIDIKKNPLIYHDDTSIYVFVARGHEPVVVVQQY